MRDIFYTSNESLVVESKNGDSLPFACRNRRLEAFKEIAKLLQIIVDLDFDSNKDPTTTVRRRKWIADFLQAVCDAQGGEIFPFSHFDFLGKIPVVHLGHRHVRGRWLGRCGFLWSVHGILVCLCVKRVSPPSPLLSALHRDLMVQRKQRRVQRIENRVKKSDEAI